MLDNLSALSRSQTNKCKAKRNKNRDDRKNPKQSLNPHMLNTEIAL